MTECKTSACPLYCLSSSSNALEIFSNSPSFVVVMIGGLQNTCVVTFMYTWLWCTGDCPVLLSQGIPKLQIGLNSQPYSRQTCIGICTNPPLRNVLQVDCTEVHLPFVPTVHWPHQTDHSSGIWGAPGWWQYGPRCTCYPLPFFRPARECAPLLISKIHFEL